MVKELMSGRRWLARASKWLATAAAAGVLAACGGGGGGGSGGQGTLSVALTDAPSCGYDHVFVTVEKVRVHRSAGAEESEGGWSELLVTPPRRVDLLELTNGILEELGSTPLDAGGYSQVRLVLASNTAADPLANAVQPTGGTLVPLGTPSAQQSGLKLQTHFTVEAGQTMDLVLDFDACRSVVRAGNSGKYNLKPVVSVVPRAASGVQGWVSSELDPASTTVSLQQNGAVVRSTSPAADGRFALPYLPDGDYDLVLTSEGRATLVVTGVPVLQSAGTTVITGTATALLAPESAMSEVTGSTVAGTGTATVVVTDATVAAKQTLSGGPTIVVASRPVDSVLGSYLLRLPRGAPLKAAYSTSGLTFATDAAAAGLYALQASAPGRTAVSEAIDVGPGNLVQDLVFAP